MVYAPLLERTLGSLGSFAARNASSAFVAASLGGSNTHADVFKPLVDREAFDAHAKIVVDGVDFRPTTDSSCFFDALEGSSTATAVMFVFITGCVLGAIPQYLKLIILGTSEGLSLTSLALMNMSNVCATLNVFILHFEQIRRCASGREGYEYERCQSSLLTLYYTVIYTLLWMPLYPLAAHFCKDKKAVYFGRVMTERRAAWYGLIAHAVPCVCVALPVVRMLFGSSCFEFETYAVYLGVCNAVLEATRYLPQLFESIYSSGSGAMSYMRLVLSIGGGLGATVQKAVMNESISTWGPPLIGHSLECAIFVVNFYNDLRTKRSRRGEGDFGLGRGKKEADGLLPTDGDDDVGDADDADQKRKAAALERAERRGNGDDDESMSGDSEDWIANMPDGSFREKSEHVWESMCTNPNFCGALVKYL
mmetsp:Transcript_4679/g.10060  ORF Transcript_4679/g.10060 Transcript_4679/m.10060 type:complete len:422 (-) Transcript_4679:69-1334(-)